MREINLLSRVLSSLLKKKEEKFPSKMCLRQIEVRNLESQDSLKLSY